MRLVRPVPADLEPVRTLLKTAIEESRYGHRFDEAKAEEFFLALIGNPQHYARIAIADGRAVGILLGSIFEMHWFDRTRTATSHVWYVLPEYRGRAGLRLLRDFLQWARTGRADEARITISSGIAPERTTSLMQRIGFEPAATTMRCIWKR